jgi:hypothetical protein
MFPDSNRRVVVSLFAIHGEIFRLTEPESLSKKKSDNRT